MQLQDWNNRRSFTSASDFYSQEATNENFISQVVNSSTIFPLSLSSKVFTVMFFFLLPCRQYLETLGHLIY